MTYAKIKDSLVVNVISLRRAQAHEFPDCVPADGILVEPGDTYADGKFYRDGEELKTNEQLAAEEAAAEATVEVLAILTGEVEE